MNGKEFELLVKRLFEENLKSSFSQDIPVQHLKEFTSAGGTKYKIDLSYELNLAGAYYLNLIECKHWNKNVDRDSVNAFQSKLQDLKAHKGFVISTKGFQAGAMKYAVEHKIALIKVVEDKLQYVHNLTGDIGPTITELITETNVMPENKPVFKGFVDPKVEIIDFISKTYGKELAEFIKNEESNRYLDHGSQKLPAIIKEQLNSIPEDFIQQYYKIETGGMPIILTNEGDLRVIALEINMLKVSDGNL